MAAVTPKTLQSQSWIQKTPGVCGGNACVRNTRITVWGIISWRRLGLADERIIEITEGLTPDDMRAATHYYSNHTAEIDEAIRLNEEA